MRSTAILAVSLGSGGAEKQVVLLANHLAREGRRPLVVTLIDNTHRLPDLDGSVDYVCLGLEPGSYRPWALSRAFKQARDVMLWHNPSHMVSFTDPANRLGWALRASGVPARHVLSERSSYLGGAAGVNLRRLLYRNAEVVVANTHATEWECLRKGLITKDRICVIPNAVSMPEIPKPQARVGGPFHWICVARLHPAKDIPSLILASDVLRAAGYDFTVDVVGSGLLEEVLAEQATSLGLGATVRFLGERRDVPALLQGSDGFVLSSAYEGLPNAVLEAAGAGLPVVATDVGGTREALPADSHGLLAPPGDPVALAGLMAQVMAMSQDSRAAVSESNAKHVRAAFSPEAVFRLWDSALSRGA